MPSAKSGKAIDAVPPAAPKAPSQAAGNKPGEVGSNAAAPGSSSPANVDSVKVKPHNPDDAKNDPKKTAWIEIEMVGEDDKPIVGERYRIALPDGTTVDEGTLNEKGFARIEGFEPGSCKISFPNLDAKAWKKL